MAAPRPSGSIDIWNFVDNVTGVTVRKWLRDSWARRKIAALQQAVAAIVVPTKTSDLTNDSGFITAASVPSASAANPAMDGTAAPGTSGAWARGDHVHPHDTSKADAATTLSGYGITDAYTKTEVDGMIPTVPSASTTAPAMDGTASAGTSTAWARGDHVHPHDTTKQDALSAAQLAAANSGITSANLAVNDSSVLCTVTPIVPTLDAGTHHATYGGCWYYKIGHRVCVHIGVAGITANTTTTLWQMPAGYIPYSGIAVNGQGSGYNNVSRARVTGTGAVIVNSANAYATAYLEYDAFS